MTDAVSLSFGIVVFPAPVERSLSRIIYANKASVINTHRLTLREATAVSAKLCVCTGVCTWICVCVCVSWPAVGLFPICIFPSVLFKLRNFSQLKCFITINIKMFVDNTLSCCLRKVTTKNSQQKSSLLCQLHQNAQ